MKTRGNPVPFQSGSSHAPSSRCVRRGDTATPALDGRRPCVAGRRTAASSAHAVWLGMDVAAPGQLGTRRSSRSVSPQPPSAFWRRLEPAAPRAARSPGASPRRWRRARAAPTTCRRCSSTPQRPYHGPSSRCVRRMNVAARAGRLERRGRSRSVPSELEPAPGEVLGRRIEQGAVVGERDVVQIESVVVGVERRPAAVLIPACRGTSRARARCASRRALGVEPVGSCSSAISTIAVSSRSG